MGSARQLIRKTQSCGQQEEEGRAASGGGLNTA